MLYLLSVKCIFTWNVDHIYLTRPDVEIQKKHLVLIYISLEFLIYHVLEYVEQMQKACVRLQQ